MPLDRLLLVCLGMSLFTQEALSGVLHKLVKGSRLLEDEDAALLASKSALCQGRARLGARPVVDLYHS